MSKVHRRKKLQIAKDFVCTYGCGKAYGSYAALYTHIKNKHSSSNEPFLRIQGNLVRSKKTGRKGRPIRKPKQQVEIKEIPGQDCKICQEQECCCDSQICNSDIAKTIKILQEPTFVEFINLVGQLQVSQIFTCIRDSQEDAQILQTETIREMYEQFLEKCNKDYNISQIWVEYLSFSSRFWNAKSIKQLYMMIFLILSAEEWELEKMVGEMGDFGSLRRLVEGNSKEWKDLVVFLQQHR